MGSSGGILLFSRYSTEKKLFGKALPALFFLGLLFFLKPLIAYYNSGFVNGLYRTEHGGKLYVSPGTGLWSGFSCRIGVPSEITRIVLKRSR